MLCLTNIKNHILFMFVIWIIIIKACHYLLNFFKEILIHQVLPTINIEDVIVK